MRPTYWNGSAFKGMRQASFRLVLLKVGLQG